MFVWWAAIFHNCANSLLTRPMVREKSAFLPGAGPPPAVSSPPRAPAGGSRRPRSRRREEKSDPQRAPTAPLPEPPLPKPFVGGGGRAHVLASWFRFLSVRSFCSFLVFLLFSF